MSINKKGWLQNATSLRRGVDRYTVIFNNITTSLKVKKNKDSRVPAVPP